MKLFLPDIWRQKIMAESRVAFPRECCGLLEGVIERDTVHVVAIHTARNLSLDDDRFEIDPADHLAVQKTARANGNAIIGCYHSHPNGRIDPSTRDTERAWDEDFIWLIAALLGHGPVDVKAHLRKDGIWHSLEIEIQEPPV